MGHEIAERLTWPDRLTTVNLGRYADGMTSPPRDRAIPDLVSLAEAAEILHISRQAVHKRATHGQLLGAQAGTTWVFRRTVVEAAAKDDQPDA